MLSIASIPLAFLGLGASGMLRSGRFVTGLVAGRLAGALGGGAAGLAYVVAGKPALNIPVGILAWALSGAALGFAGALLVLYRTKRLST
jgi:hypothetical protein